MNQNHSHRTLACSFFVLVSPSAVIGQRFALEELWVIRGRLTHQHQQNSAVHVGALVVVPVIFGRFDTVAHKYDVRIDLRLRLLCLIRSNVVGERLQLHRRSVVRYKRECGVEQGGYTDQRYFLQVAAAVSRRLQTIFGKLSCHVLGREIAAALACPPAFQQIMCQKAHMPSDVVGANCFHGGKRRSW